MKILTAQVILITKRGQNSYLCRIIRLAMHFDAMTTDRPYRKGLSIEEAMNEIKKFRKIQFDPVVADAFIELYQEGILKKIMDELKAKFG